MRGEEKRREERRGEERREKERNGKRSFFRNSPRILSAFLIII
jgi:hypothetical protein